MTYIIASNMKPCFAYNNGCLLQASDCAEHFTCVILFSLQQQPSEVGSPLDRRGFCGSEKLSNSLKDIPAVASDGART